MTGGSIADAQVTSAKGIVASTSSAAIAASAR
jgi:hypothetical protein